MSAASSVEFLMSVLLSFYLLDSLHVLWFDPLFYASVRHAEGVSHLLSQSPQVSSSSTQVWVGYAARKQMQG